MSDLANGAEKPTKADDADDVLSVGRARLDMAISALSGTRTTEVEDLKFYAGNSDNNFQWPTEIAAQRGVGAQGDLGARPMLTVNKLPQHVKQITNEALQNPLAAKVVPADSQADVEVAEIYQGIIRQIESDSDADVAYSTANDNQTIFGEGYFRVVTEYVDSDSFDQEIKIERIRNSFSVYMDPLVQHPTGRDQKWCWITEDITHEEYEQQYPDATTISGLSDLGIGNPSIASWVNNKTVRIGEYFYFHIEMGTLHLYSNGQKAWKGTPEDDLLSENFGKPVKTRQSEKVKQIKWIKTNGYDILEERDWAGKWIPIVRVLGNEFEIEGELTFSGIVRNAKDPQRRYNYLSSAEVEMIALAPKAPFIGYAGQFEGYEEEWKTANTKNWPYLQVNPDIVDGEGRVLPLPQRAQPAMPQAGIIAAKQAASEDIKETTGQYNASLGQHSNERTGRAILARQAEGDKSTYHYLSNLSRAIRHLTRILIDLIPKIYDTARVAQVLGEDGKSKPVRLDPEQPEAVREVQNPLTGTIEKIYNPNVGKYSVIPSSGPSYATKRIEQAEGMSKIMQTNPQLMGVAGDIFVESMDWPNAQRFAKRLAKTLPPELRGDDDDPVQRKMQEDLEQTKQQLQQALMMLKQVPQSMEARELQIKEYEAKIKAFQAETERIKVMQGGLTLDQVHDVAAGTVDAALHSNGLLVPPQQPQQPSPAPQPPSPQEPQQMMPGGAPSGGMPGGM